MSSYSSYQGVADLPDTVWLLLTMAFVYPFIHIRTLSDAGAWLYIYYINHLICCVSLSDRFFMFQCAGALSYIGVGTIAIVNVIVISRSIYTR